jgi:hypothetical protein
VNCEQFREMLLQGFDGPALTDPALADHARQCSRCAALLAADQRLKAGLGQWQRPMLPAGLTAQIVTAVHTQQRRQLRLRRVRAFVGALAASLCLAAGVAYFWPRTQPAGSSPLVQYTEPSHPETTATLRETVNQASQAVTQLTTRTADTTVEQTRSFWPVLAPPALDDWDKQPPMLEPPARPLQETGQSAVAALEPVTESARRAFGMFLHDLRPMDQPAKPDS